MQLRGDRFEINDRNLVALPLAPFDERICGFLEDVSRALMAKQDARNYSDVMAFAFFCRGANLTRLKKNYIGESRLGLGVAFHMPAANVPLGFAFSFLFGILSGNANRVRVPSHDFPQIKIIIDEIETVFSWAKYSVLREMNEFIRYQADEKLTTVFSAEASARLLWGGDETIDRVRKFPTPTRSVDLVFRDRYSISLVNADSVAKLSDQELSDLSAQFYADTYSVEQLACSSPSVLIWIGNRKAEAQDRFWGAVEKRVASGFQMEPVTAVEKLSRFCTDAAQFDILPMKGNGAKIMRVELRSHPSELNSFRGGRGYFYEFAGENIEQSISLIDERCQTLTYFGLAKEDIRAAVLTQRCRGVDRIVPIGTALTMELVWDGYDLIRSLSRIIEIK